MYTWFEINICFETWFWNFHNICVLFSASPHSVVLKIILVSFKNNYWYLHLIIVSELLCSLVVIYVALLFRSNEKELPTVLDDQSRDVPSHGRRSRREMQTGIIDKHNFRWWEPFQPNLTPSIFGCNFDLLVIMAR